MRKILRIGALAVLLGLMTAGTAAGSARPVYAAGAPDYILGRPMTEEEIREQKAQEPERLPVNPVIEAPEPEDVALDHVELAGEPVKLSVLPDAYDSRTEGNVVTPVKNQLPYGTCWAFGAVASAESCLQKKGICVQEPGKLPDLSELQLVYFFYHPEVDKLGNTAGDSSSAMGSVSFLDRGGHGIFTTFCLASWVGLVNEDVLPYECASYSMTQPKEYCRDVNVAHMQNSCWVKMTDTDGVKLLIQEYGSVSVSFYYSDSFYNYDTAGYYNDAYTQTNHAVNIVGWDDSYAVENFTTAPEEAGAWLVKNNWGSSWGDEGYFWISYEDMSFTGTAAFGYVYDLEPAYYYENIYQYDGSWSYARRNMNSGQSAANVYTVSGYEAERLTAVSIAVYSPNTGYSIQIYRDPKDGDPTSGTPLLTKPQTGTISYAGYATIPLDAKDLVFRRGERFSVVFTLTSPDGSQVQVLEDKSGTNGGWIRFVNDTKPGQSYILKDTGWTDLGKDSSGAALGTSGETIRIKAFTEETDIPISGVKVDRTKLSMVIGDKETLTAELLPSNHTEEEEILWSSSDTTVATVKNGVVTARAVGTAVITAEVPGCCAKCTVTVGLAAPEMVSAEGYGFSRIKVTWKTVPGAEGYRLYQKTYGGEWRRIAVIETADKLTFINRVPEYDTKYYYAVRAFSNRTGTTVLSDYSSKSIGGTAVPQQPVLKAPVRTDSYVKVCWNTVKCDGYRVYRMDDAGVYKRIKTIDGSSVSSYKDTNVTGTKDYTYTVRAFFREGDVYAAGTYDKTGRTAVAVFISGVSLSKTTASVKVGEKLTLTAGLLPSNHTETASFTWKSSNTTVASVSGGTITAKAVGTAVITVSAAGFSKKCTVTVGLAAPVMRSAQGTDFSKIKVTWNSVPGAEGYRLYRKTYGGEWKRIATIETPDKLTFTNKVPEPTTKYYYVVKAYSNRTGTTVLSSYSSKNVSAKAVPEQPVLAGLIRTQTGLKLSWGTVNCDGYRVYRKEPGGEYKRIKTITGSSVSSYTDTGAVKGKTYIYTARAYFREGDIYAMGSYDTEGLKKTR